jgi:hypothetical protein
MPLSELQLRTRRVPCTSLLSIFVALSPELAVRTGGQVQQLSTRPLRSVAPPRSSVAQASKDRRWPEADQSRLSMITRLSTKTLRRVDWQYRPRTPSQLSCTIRGSSSGWRAVAARAILTRRVAQGGRSRRHARPPPRPAHRASRTPDPGDGPIDLRPRRRRPSRHAQFPRGADTTSGNRRVS